MGWDAPDPYYNPEKFGLEIVASHDVAASYEYDMIVIWRHAETGRLYMAHDYGCSCFSPFEGLTDMNDLSEFRNEDEIRSFAKAQSWTDREISDLIDSYRRNAG